MADFVKDAFRDAVNASEEAEYHAYQNDIVNNIDAIIMTAGAMTGMDNMNKLSKVIIQAGQAETLAEFTKGLVMTAFHIGYTKGRESA
jgi:hypothetical protein